MNLLSLAGVLLSGFCLFAADTARLRLTSPSSGQTLRGRIWLAASADSAIRRVEYRIGSHSLGSAQPPTFKFRWNSAESMDGTIAIQALGLTEDGRLLSEAESVVTVSNRGAAVTVNSPDLNQTLSGKVDIDLTGFDSPAFPAVWTLNVDGEEQSTAWTDNKWRSPISVRLPLDTTRFSNGRHELQINMNSRSGPDNPAWVNWRGMVNRIISLQNGRAWMDSAADFQNVYLRPGQTIELGCRRLYTDGSESACNGQSYQSADPRIASVDGKGSVTARRNGFTRVTLTDGRRKAEAQVWVANDSSIPHFAGNGALLHIYDKGRSFLPIAPFFLDPDSIHKDPSLQKALAQAGVNTLSFGLYPNPRDVTASYAAWEEKFDATVLPKLRYAQEHGFHLLLSGDDIAREREGDARFTLKWPAAPKALAYSMRRMAETKVGVGVDVIDEGSRLWGPKPPAALTTIRQWLSAPQAHVPIAWPALAADSPAVQGNWMGRDGISDYASHYFTSLKTRTTYPWSEGIQEMVSSMQTEFFARQPFMMLDRPQLMLVSLAGPSYTKRSRGTVRYEPGVDALEYPGVSPEHVSALMMTAVALGGAGIRLYYFESASDGADRARAKIGTYFQTGANPSNFQPEAWKAMGLAANLITQVLQPQLLGKAMNSPALGRNIVTAVREGSDSVLLLIVNGNEWPRHVKPRLTTYDRGKGASRFQLSSGRLYTSQISSKEADDVVLGSGESIAYLFPF